MNFCEREERYEHCPDGARFQKRIAYAVLHRLLRDPVPPQPLRDRYDGQAGRGSDRLKDHTLNGSQGGDQQIGARIACNEIDLLLIFRDPLNPKPHEPKENNLLRLCDVHNIPVATNIATAEAIIHSLERGDLDWRDIVNPK